MKKKGFTLVELLAVIAILAILVIIALPNVMGMFNQAKQNSFSTEIKEIYKQAQQQWISDSMLSTGKITYYRSNGNSASFVDTTASDKKIDLTGRTQLDYLITIEKSGKVTAYYATDGSYQYTYTGTDLKVEDIGTASSGNNSIAQVSALSGDTKLCINGSSITPVTNATSSTSCYPTP